MQSLDHYSISADRGFLCNFDADKVQLNGMISEAANVALDLPDLLPTGRVRDLLREGLPDPSKIVEELVDCSDEEARLCMVHYSFMVQAYVWGETEAPERLPQCLAIPMVTAADRLGQQPLLQYSGYVLDNWAKINPDSKISLENIRMIQNFLAGQDEAWFVLIHVAIEAAAGGVLAKLPILLDAAENHDSNAVRENLEQMAGIWQTINKIFDRMLERCDPYIYFERVRPYIHGWKDNPALPNGVIYEGVKRYGGAGKAFRGQTGSQSSIVPAMDAAMGVGHANDPLKEYLDQLHIYRPLKHRQFIDDLRAESSVREFVANSRIPGLTDAYNANIQAVSDFRSRHLEYAASYIHKQSRQSSGNDTDVGTGGTPFMKYLKKHRDETQRQLLAS